MTLTIRKKKKGKIGQSKRLKSLKNFYVENMLSDVRQLSVLLEVVVTTSSGQADHDKKK